MVASGGLTHVLFKLYVFGGCGKQVDDGFGEDGEVVIEGGRSAVKMVIGTGNEGKGLRMVGRLTVALVPVDVVGRRVMTV